MNLRQVREAAEHHWSAMMRKYILATVDAEPDAAITADWLREVWGASCSDSQNSCFLGNYMFVPQYGEKKQCRVVRTDTWLDLSTDDVEIAIIKNRQQFTDLAKALNIPRRTKHA